MKLIKNFSPIVKYAPEVADLMMSGIQWLAHMDRPGQQLGFVQWSRLMRSARGHSDKLSADQLIWLWDALTSEPRLCKHLGERLVSIDELWRKCEPIKVLPAGSRFAIFLKGFRRHDKPFLPLQSHLRPEAEAEILDDLQMKPGKARRLECLDVSTCLEVRPSKLGSKQDEAAALKVNTEQIDIADGLLRVGVKSLNHAYTKTSLRLEPHRRSHGGRVYDHVALIEADRKDKYVPLERIRLKYERELWEQLVTG